MFAGLSSEVEDHTLLMKWWYVEALIAGVGIGWRALVWFQREAKYPLMGIPDLNKKTASRRLCGRKGTRTPDLLCVREFLKISIVSTPYRWWY